MDGYNEDFWKALDELVSNSEIVIDKLFTGKVLCIIF
jgi:hypothetical protein